MMDSCNTPTPPDSRLVASPASDASSATGKSARNHRACDACRSRKIRCNLVVGNTVQCQGCASLEIECTYNRVRKKRGPANKHARNASVSGVSSDHNAAQPIVPSPSSTVPQMPPSLDASSSSSARSSALPFFASEPVVSALLHSWFEKIHPVIPILHRRSLLARVERGEHLRNPSCCGLVLSICALTMAALPREQFGLMTVQGCLDYIDEKKLVTPGFARCAYSLDWCISMYNIAVAMISTSKSHATTIRVYHALCEAFAGVRYLTFFGMDQLDSVEQQLLIRLFWVLFGASWLVPPPPTDYARRVTIHSADH
ncbi:hypothetical protein BJX76DRAFT_243430 [Aspergillus varians]